MPVAGTGKLLRLASVQLCLAQIMFVLLWSSGFVAGKFGLTYVGTFTFLFFRCGLVALVLVGFVLVRRRFRFGSWSGLQQVAMIGVLAHALHLSTMWLAFGLGASAGAAALVGGLHPALTGLLASRAVGERIGTRQWLGLFIGLAAFVIIIGGDLMLGASVLAYVLLFASVGCVTIPALYQRWMDIHAPSEPIPLVENLAIQFSAATLALWLPAYFLEGFQATWSIGFVSTLAWLAVFVSLGGYGFMLFLLQRSSATKVASLTYFTVPVTMLLGYLAFGETLTAVDVFGCLLAAVGVLLVQRAQGPAPIVGTRSHAHGPGSGGVFQRLPSVGCEDGRAPRYSTT